MSYTYEFPKADTTATVIAYALFDKQVDVLAILRGREPFAGQLALPGGFLEIGKETLEECAVRELAEETGLLARLEDLTLVCVRSDPQRDPRGHVIDHVYAVRFDKLCVCHAGDDAAAIQVISFSTHQTFFTGFAFDHGDSLYDFFNHMIRGH